MCKSGLDYQSRPNMIAKERQSRWPLVPCGDIRCDVAGRTREETFSNWFLRNHSARGEQHNNRAEFVWACA